VPRFLFPAVAVAGAALVLRSLVRALARSARRDRREGRLELLPVVANLVAAVVLVVLPFTRLVGVIAASRDRAPRVLAGFGDWLGGEGYPRLSAHRGVDIAGRIGAAVLAVADGRVTVARDSHDLCGLIVVIDHDPHGYRTIYCHFSVISVRPGERVTRGQRIGAIGTSGQRAWPGYEHVHLELQRGRDVQAVEDPVPRIVGCFDATVSYPTDRLVLTHPVTCQASPADAQKIR
jgi:murein DD-endopeptidase MepM/ murein hydrolase activator NlpD